MELVVRGNQWFTVGDTGAEMANIRKNDIIFNNKQTEEIFKNGYVTSGGGRGKIANANGNAYASGTAYSTGSNALGSGGFLGGASIYNGYYNGGSGKATTGSISNKAEEETKEVIDWVEIMIDRIERAIDDLDAKASSVYRSWSDRNENLAEELAKTREEITLQQSAYNTYMKKANSIDLSETYKKKVRNGKLEIEDITDEDLQKKIQEYQEWWNFHATVYRNIYKNKLT